MNDTEKAQKSVSITNKINKQTAILLLMISLFVFFTNFVFVVIGSNSNVLITKFWYFSSMILFILSFFCVAFSLYIILKNRRNKIKIKLCSWILIVLLFVYALGCSSIMFLLYGPYDNFRVWLITTSNATKSHRHYSTWLYSQESIDEVLGENFVDDGGAETDTSLIDHSETEDDYPTVDPDDNESNDSGENVDYNDSNEAPSDNKKDEQNNKTPNKTTTDNLSEYEKAVLDREPGTLYKIIRFKENGCDAYLAVIYKPSKISVGYTKNIKKSGQYLVDMASEQNAVLAINGGAFFDKNHDSKGSTPIGVTISNGNIITDYPIVDKRIRKRGIIAFDNNNNLVLKQSATAQELLDQGIRDAVTMGPFLIVNGKASFVSGNGGWGYAARTAIGQRKDGIVLFLVVDSNATRTTGASMKELTRIMKNYGAVNAANLDGGTSSAMAVNGELINDPKDDHLRHQTRPIATMFKVVE